MTAAARELSLHNLSARLVVPDTGDELARLAQTWNDVVAQLELAVGGLTRFTADASHELKTPLAILRATVEIALRHERTTAEYKKALQRVEFETKFMTRLTDQLLWLARADARAEEPTASKVDLAAIVAEACEAVSPLALDRGLILQVLSSSQPVLVHANEVSLRSLVLLLLDNSLKYTPARGKVCVSTRRESGSAIIEVQDTGVGIRSEDLQLVFERFWRADKARTRGQGTGLGLSIAKKIVSLNGGSIEAESQPGEGATFRVVLPLATESGNNSSAEVAAETYR
jgi:signal transduction histidine kinase